MAHPVSQDRAAAESLIIELGWPAKELWPNGRAHHMVLARHKKAARIEAQWATKIIRPFNYAPPEAPIPVHITAYPKPFGPFPDRDGVIGSVKAHLDGIADIIEVNDRDFAAPTVSFADRCQHGKIVVRIG